MWWTGRDDTFAQNTFSRISSQASLGKDPEGATLPGVGNLTKIGSWGMLKYCSFTACGVPDDSCSFEKN